MKIKHKIYNLGLELVLQENVTGAIDSNVPGFDWSVAQK